MANYTALIESLSQEYDVGLIRTKNAVELSFKEILKKIYKTDFVDVLWDEDEIDIVVRQKGGEYDGCDRKIEPEDIGPEIIARIKKLIQKNMIVQKYDVLYQNIRTLENTLIKGFLSEKKGKDYIVNHDDLPLLFLYRKEYQPENEIKIYKIGQTYLFYVVRVELILDKPLNPVLRIILSRTDKHTPELFIKKETGINTRCILRYPSIKTVIAVDERIPSSAIEKYSKEFNERLEVRIKGNIRP